MENPAPPTTIAAARAESAPPGSSAVLTPPAKGERKSHPLQTMVSARFDSARALLIAVLVACASVPYLNALLNGFVYDDHTQVTNNPYLQNFHHLREIFTTT